MIENRTNPPSIPRPKYLDPRDYGEASNISPDNIALWFQISEYADGSLYSLDSIGSFNMW